jgi:type I restriction enzyme S subunit
MSSGSPAVVGKTASAVADWPGSVGAFCAIIRANPEKCLPEYLAFFLKSARFRKWTSEAQGANIKNIKKSALEDFEIWLPFLPEQRRIVDLLSRAEGIVRLRREAEKKAAELIPALFLYMFGDPATNPKGWPVKSLGQHVGIPSVVRTPDIATEAGLLCIGADSIESKSGKLISMPTVGDVLPKSGKYWFDADDVLYSKIRPYLAKATLAHTWGYCSADMYPLRCEPTLRPIFLLSLLLCKAFTEYATAESVRVSMPKLNREALFKYQVPVPPVDLQAIFSEQADAMQSIQSQQFAATAKAQATFDALLAQVFSGNHAE